MVFNYIFEDMNGNTVEDFEYEVFVEEQFDALGEILMEYDKKELVDLLLSYCDSYDFYDELKEYFEDDARSFYKENK